MTDLFSNLQNYVDAGYCVTPLRGKVPLRRNWPETAYEPFVKASDFPDNFGVVLQDTDLVIDVDPRNFKNGVNSFEQVLVSLSPEMLYDAIKDTFIVQTGSGGWHYYFKKPAGFETVKQLKEFPGVEFKSKGQQVVGAGCVHPETKQVYTILQGSPGEVPEAPERLLSLLKKTPDENPKQGTGESNDNEQAINRYRDFCLAADPAVQGAGGDERTLKCAFKGRDMGLSKERTLDILRTCFNPRCLPPWDENDLVKKVENAYAYAQNEIGADAPEAAFTVSEIDLDDVKFDRNEKGRLVRNQNNTVKFFTHKKSPLFEMLAFNEFTSDINFIRPAPWHKNSDHQTWTDDDAIHCKYFISHTFKFEPPTAIIHEAAIVAAQQHRFHPVKEYIIGIKWDGHKRIHNWMTTFLGAEDNLYTRSVGAKMLLAAVSRVFSPGCKFDYIPVFEGLQGIGKSRMISVLASPWHSDQILDIHSRDTIDAMRGKWIIEVSEMETHYRSETQAMKAFLSRSTDRVRLAYARISRDFPRQCIFVGTINPESDDDVGYLKDTTGNRRYWPVKVHKVDIAGLSKIRDQLWAEAYQTFLRGEKVYMDDRSIEEQAAVEQKKRMGVDPWLEKIRVWLNSDMFAINKKAFTGAEIFADCIGGKMQQYTRKEMVRIANIMTDLGWEKGTYRDPVNGDVTRGYLRPVIE